MWFTDISIIENPGRDELHRFLDCVIDFLGFVLEQREFDFLWKNNPELRSLARETYSQDVRERGAGELHAAISDITEDALLSHGLIGRPMRFKLKVLASVSDRWQRVRGQITIRAWFKRVI